MRRLLTLILTLIINLSFGQIIEDFTLINAVDQSNVSLSTFNKAKGIAVIFTSNSCPYSKLYENRILKLHENYTSQGLRVILINPNNPVRSPEDQVSKLKARATTQNYSFPYLVDSDQKVSKNFGAKKTPEVFLLKPSKDRYEVIYRGSFDDNPQNEEDIKEPYLIRAVEGLFENKPIPDHSRPVGCIIKS